MTVLQQNCFLMVYLSYKTLLICSHLRLEKLKKSMATKLCKTKRKYQAVPKPFLKFTSLFGALN